MRELCVALTLMMLLPTIAFAAVNEVGENYFATDAVLFDPEILPLWSGMQGRRFQAVTFSTYNTDSGSFSVEPAFSYFVAHTGTKCASKMDGWDGTSNFPPPIIAATFSTPVYATGAWIVANDISFVRLLDANQNTLAYREFLFNQQMTFVGFNSTQPIAQMLIGNKYMGGIAFDDFYYSTNPVPEPSGCLLFFSAMGGISMLFRRRHCAV